MNSNAGRADAALSARAAVFAAAALFASVAAAQPLATPAGASERVTLSASVEREIPADTLVATLFVEGEDRDPGRLAERLREPLERALAAARAYPTVRASTGAYSTWPWIGAKGERLGWRSRAELRLQSRDFAAAAKLIGELQQSLELGAIGFSVSRERRTQVENELIAEAIAAFRARAEIVRRSLDAVRYAIRRLEVHTGAALPPPRPLAAAALAREAVPLPLEAGGATVSVRVEGDIEVE